MTSTLRRTGAVAALALTLVGGLSACGSSDDTSNASTDGTTTAMASDAGAQTFGPACSSIPKSGSGSFDGMVKDPVATAASNNPLLSTLVTAVNKAGLADTLNGADGLTVFAPTNDAFGKLPKKQLAAVLASKKLLTEVLTHHVIAGQLDPAKIDGTQTTLNKDTVTVKGGTDGMTVDGAHVLCGNIPTSNATVYVIDQVLIPTM